MDYKMAVIKHSHGTIVTLPTQVWRNLSATSSAKPQWLLKMSSGSPGARNPDAVNGSTEEKACGGVVTTQTKPASGVCLVSTTL